MFILRDYQTESVRSVWSYFQNGGTGNPLIALPTGTGKSLVIAAFAQSVFHYFPNQRIIMLTHVKELIEQNFNKMMTMWPTAPAGVYSAGLKRRDLYNSITFAGIGSVAKRANQFGHIDLIIIDEAHLVSPSQSTMYQKFINELLKFNPHVKVIGLTATPYRLGHGELTEDGGLFTDICIDLTTMEAFNRFISEGYIVSLIPKRTDLVLDVDGVHKRGGEFIASQLQLAVDQTEITEAACREAMELGHDRGSWLVFATGVEHAVHTAEILNHIGVPALVVHGGNKDYKITNQERDDAIARFKSGEVRALVNNNVLTTGFDHPPIDMIVMLRPTSSPGLWVQMLGRGTRPWYAEGYDLSTIEGRLAAIEASPKKNCLVLDFGGNTKRLGPINDPVIPGRKGKGTGEAPVKICEAINNEGKICNSWVHASLRICPYCANEFPLHVKIKETAGTDELIKGDLPVVKVFKVDHITYSVHNKQGRPPSMKVSYYCGLKLLQEFVCFEHEGFAARKAKSWWKERSQSDVPQSTTHALEIVTNAVSAATHLRVWTNKKYPEIMACCYDGSAFGEDAAGSDAPTSEAHLDGIKEDDFNSFEEPPETGLHFDCIDDIPF